MFFFNELTKRELGRIKCLEVGCTHYLNMDADEYYLEDQMKEVKKKLLNLIMKLLLVE